MADRVGMCVCSVRQFWSGTLLQGLGAGTCRTVSFLCWCLPTQGNPTKTPMCKMLTCAPSIIERAALLACCLVGPAGGWVAM